MKFMKCERIERGTKGLKKYLNFLLKLLKFHFITSVLEKSCENSISGKKRIERMLLKWNIKDTIFIFFSFFYSQ